MSSPPVNLNRVRKDKARRAKKQRADENAVKFGRRKHEKALDRAQSEKTARDHDGQKRDR